MATPPEELRPCWIFTPGPWNMEFLLPSCEWCICSFLLGEDTHFYKEQKISSDQITGYTVFFNDRGRIKRSDGRVVPFVFGTNKEIFHIGGIVDFEIVNFLRCERGVVVGKCSYLQEIYAEIFKDGMSYL